MVDPPDVNYTDKAPVKKRKPSILKRATKKRKKRSVEELAALKPGAEPVESKYEGRLQKPLVPSDYTVAEWIDAALDRFALQTDREYFKELLTKIIEQNAAPAEMFAVLPQKPQKTGITRFDQIYQAMQYISFPPYSKSIINGLLGTGEEFHMKVWRVSLPERFKVGNTLIRAETYQDAFALACDYACRIHLRLYKSIPRDLTLRVQYMSGVAIAKYLGVRQKIRNNKSRVYYSGASREFTPKQILGARTAALGHAHNDPNRSIAIYADRTDQHKARRYQGMIRIVNVELESLIDHPERGKTHAEKLQEHRNTKNPQAQDKESGDENG